MACRTQRHVFSLNSCHLFPIEQSLNASISCKKSRYYIEKTIFYHVLPCKMFTMENFPTFLQIFPCKDFTFLYKTIILSYILQKI